jgi:hypothetical protein
MLRDMKLGVRLGLTASWFVMTGIAHPDIWV